MHVQAFDTFEELGKPLGVFVVHREASDAVIELQIDRIFGENSNVVDAEVDEVADVLRPETPCRDLLTFDDAVAGRLKHKMQAVLREFDMRAEQPVSTSTKSATGGSEGKKNACRAIAHEVLDDVGMSVISELVYAGTRQRGERGDGPLHHLRVGRDDIAPELLPGLDNSGDG